MDTAKFYKYIFEIVDVSGLRAGFIKLRRLKEQVGQAGLQWILN